MVWSTMKDASKIKKAEKRSAAKLKTLQEKKKKSDTKCSFSAPSPNSASRFGGAHASGSFPPAGNYFRPQGWGLRKHFQRRRFAFSMRKERSLGQFLPLQR